MTSKEERLTTIAVLLKHNNITPNDNKYAGVIRKIECSTFFSKKQTIDEDIKTLTTSWKSDQWQTLTENVIVVPKPQSQTKEAPLQIEEPEQPIYELTEKDKAKILHNLATKDTNQDNIGRLLITELRHEFDDKTLTADSITQLWQQYYPDVDIEEKTVNVLLVYWDGKQTTKEKRSHQTPVNIQEAPTFIEPKQVPEKTHTEKDDWFYGEKYESATPVEAVPNLDMQNKKKKKG
jgi:hypothetical protein